MNMFIRCARCGKIHWSTSTMRKIVSYNGKKMVRVCYDERACWPKIPVRAAQVAR